ERPMRPRPAYWASASITVPAGAPSAASSWAISRVEPTRSNNRTRGTDHRPARSFSSAPSNLTIGPRATSASKGNHEHRGAAQHAIDGARYVALVRDESEQRGNREPAADRRREHADHQRRGEPFRAEHLRHL